jgi:hypothetical protein
LTFGVEESSEPGELAGALPSISSTDRLYGMEIRHANERTLRADLDGGRETKETTRTREQRADIVHKEASCPMLEACGDYDRGELRWNGTTDIKKKVAL